MANADPKYDNHLRLSQFQQRVLQLPLEYSVFLGGGKGGSKSFTLCLLAQSHCETFKEDATPNQKLVFPALVLCKKPATFLGTRTVDFLTGHRVG